MGSGKLVNVTWKTTLDESDLYNIIESYAEGAGIVELARAYRVRTAVINEILAENGVPQRKTLTAGTPIECRLHDALMAAGIGFATQKRLVGRYVVDISIRQAPVVIEADGARHRAGAQAQERDEVRDAAHEAAGYRVFRFSGSEINTDAVKCVRVVTDACGLVPDEEPVYDIQTSFSGTDHPRWVGPHERTCEYCGQIFYGRAKRKYCSHEHFVLGAINGKPKSAEHRAKIGAANHRRMQSGETRAKISAAKSGTRLTAEHRARISAGVRARRDQIKIESELTRERESGPETGPPATLF